MFFFDSPDIIVSIYTFLESSSRFLASNLAGISWDSEKVLSGTASLEENTKFLACTLIMCHSIPFWFMNLFYETIQLLFTKKQLAPWRANGELFPERSLVNKAYVYVTGFHIVISYFIYHYGARLLLENGLVRSVSLQDITATNVNATSSSSSSLVVHPWSFPLFFARLVACLFIGDAAFYISHATLHLPGLYEHIHKQHHMFKITCSVAAEYAAPLELIFGNIFVVLAGPAIFKFHAVVWCVFLALAIHSTTMSHSGYWYLSRNLWFHDHHHRVNIGNYSSLGWIDAVLGTDKAWRRMKEKEKEKQERRSISASS